MPEWAYILLIGVVAVGPPSAFLLSRILRQHADQEAMARSRKVFMNVLSGQRWDIEGIGRVRVVDVETGYHRTTNRQVHACVSGPSGLVWLCAEQWERLATPYYGEL